MQVFLSPRSIRQSVKLAVAQIHPVKGDIAANIVVHMRLIEQATAQSANALFFPELSLTGYEPELANALVTTPDDPRLNVFQNLSDAHSLTIGVGLPIRTDAGVQIGMVIFQPDQPRQTYGKQQLHADELPYFVPGDSQIMIRIDGQIIAPAICYESLQPIHAQNAHESGATIYVASVAKSQAGVDKAMAHYPAIARRYGMPVLMVNCVGYCDNFLSAGQSGAWNSRGELMGQLGREEEGVLVVDDSLLTRILLR